VRFSLKSIKIEINPPTLNDICTLCWGTGYQKAMQMAARLKGDTIRVQDKEVKCIHCNGTGYEY